MRPTSLDRYRGCLLGGAAGDALGAAVEFMGLEEIRAGFGPSGIAEPAEAYGRVGAITDDTQMTLFTAEGLLQADVRLERGIGNPPYMLWLAYQRWLSTQGISPAHHAETAIWYGELQGVPELRSRRAPGRTCVSALQAPFRDPQDGPANNDSKGCGGVMRAAPCGLTGWREESVFLIGKLGASLTHGNPAGYLTAGALAVMIQRLVRGDGMEAATSDPATVDPATVDTAVARAVELARTRPGSVEALQELGQGWVAEEALAIAVYAALSHPGDFAAGVRLAVNHGGDSDSTGAIAGNLLGTALGVEAIPAGWLGVLELRDTIDRLARAMHQRFVEDRDDIDWNLWERPSP